MDVVSGKPMIKRAAEDTDNPLTKGADGRLWRRCSQCGHWKVQSEEFSPHNKRPCGYQAACRSCRAKNASAARWAKRRAVAGVRRY